MNRTRASRWICSSLAVAAALAGGASCSAPGGPGSASDFDWRGDAAPRPTDGPAATPPAGECRPVRASEQLTAREAVIAAPGDRPSTGPAKEQQVFVSDLFNQFRSYCGACHVDSNQGNFQVTSASFSTAMDRDKVLGSMKSDDLLEVMPPPVAGGIGFSRRSPNDPVLDLLGKLEVWFAKGKPSGVFDMLVPAGPELSGSVEQRVSYLVSQELAGQLTNLGSCVPTREQYATMVEPMDALDDLFARATTLPGSLAETDLVSLDSAQLAQRGVIAFVPAYPLWSDNSAKMRVVRVPRGTSIRFDPETQKFHIPPNTRFYKTFLKKIVDVNGTERYRKIETRLILARPDEPQEDGTSKVTALYGTYAWNEDETEARLVQDPLRNGQPFKDRLITYVTNEPLAAQVRESVRARPRDLGYALDDENPGLLRRYAIPGAQRCLECHMGSPGADFVLGFTPLQIKRRRAGQGGIENDPNTDELNQLKRFIELGLVTGLDEPTEILSLEDSQGERKARNRHELEAQAYLLGNCSHCHNPRGFPSVKEPMLREALDFLPTAEGGGIFQFPLDRFSPVRQRGQEQNVPMPYITPSLFDYPSQGDPSVYRPKCEECAEGGGAEQPFCEPGKARQCIEAPWRSLVYRNVDTPFIYTEDFTIFPHMPRNSAGFDCRAPQVLGNWMVSIPARPERPDPKNPGVELESDKAPQPYVEVRPDDPGYDEALDAAERRLQTFNKGKRYGFCPDTTDIVDPAVRKATSNADLVPKDDVIFDPKREGRWRMVIDGVPDKPHWVDSDTTDTPGDWSPRRIEWVKHLVELEPDQGSGDVPEILQDVFIDEELRRFVRTPFPMGLWKETPGSTCDFSRVRKAGAFAGPERLEWMDKQNVPPEAPVYALPPGEAVFNQICINCHGPRADSKGLLAEAISEATGGGSRVANFRDGILGSVADPGGNFRRVFGPEATAGARPAPSGRTPTAEDWAGRYIAWMALGGTNRLIPQGLLNMVGTTPVLDRRRAGFRINSTPNMLQVATELCKLTLPVSGFAGYSVPLSTLIANGRVQWSQHNLEGLITENGDAALWVQLCNLGNYPVVRVVDVGGDDMGEPGINPATSFYWATTTGPDGKVVKLYPDSAPVMNHLGQIEQGIQPGNFMPMCVPQRTCASPADKRCLKAEEVHTQRRIPWCPPELLVTRPDGNPQHLFRSMANDQGGLKLPDAEKWAKRGAVNAGLAVFLYLQDLERGAVVPTPGYNKCEKLSQLPAP